MAPDLWIRVQCLYGSVYCILASWILCLEVVSQHTTQSSKDRIELEAAGLPSYTNVNTMKQQYPQSQWVGQERENGGYWTAQDTDVSPSTVGQNNMYAQNSNAKIVS